MWIQFRRNIYGKIIKLKYLKLINGRKPKKNVKINECNIFNSYINYNCFKLFKK